jgi:CDP-diacylglycerol--serine O-phosphatidyltransferase
MKGRLTLANLLTTANLTAGFFAILQIFEGNFIWTAALVVLCAIFDSLDGAAARRKGSADEFGTNLDSLADVVSFGVVPALGAYFALLNALPGVGIVICLLFFVCGAWRLARFSVTKNSLYFVGVPIPVAGVIVAVIATTGLHPLITLPVVLCLSILMVSTLPFPTIAGLRNLEEMFELVHEQRQTR